MNQILNKSLSQKEIFTNALFQRPQSLSKFLPYDEYIEDKKIFVLKDGSLGAVFNLELIEHEPKSEKAILKIVNSCKEFFNLPENCTLQFLYDQSVISTRDKRYSNYVDEFKNANKFSDFLFKEKLDLIKYSKCGTPFQRSCTISIRYFPQNSKKSSIFDKGNSTLFRHTKQFVKQLREFEHIIANFTSLNSLNLTQLSADMLLSNLRKFFNPETFYKRDFASFSPNTSISEQLLYNSPTLDFSSIEREKLKTRTLTLKCAPSFVYAGGMSYFTKLDFPYSLSLNFSFPSKQKVKFFFDTKEFFLKNALSERAKAQKEEIQSVQKNLAREDRCLYLTFNIIVEGSSEEELDNKERKVANVFQRLECEIIKEDDIGLGLCLNTLPLCYSPEADISASRYIRILKKDVVNLLPIFDSFKGMKSPLLVYPSREGNLVPFSLFANDGTSHHTVICADTGSGKSTLISDLIWSSKRIDPEMITFVVDKKSSYGMLCEYFNGDMTKFDRNAENQFSPFRGIYDEEKFAFLTKLFTFAINLTSPSFNVESEHQTAISKALKQAYKKKKNRHGLVYIEGELIKKSSDDAIELEMQDFITELGQLSDGNENIQEVCQELITKLSPFYGQGVYAKFFKGSKRKKEQSKLFYIYDLDALARDPILLPLMSLTVIEEIRSILELPENKGRAGLLVLEEFAMLGKNNPIISDFIVEFAETMRKRGCWLISATPRPRNFFELSQGRALFETADNYLFLQMSDDNIEYIANQSTLFDEANKGIISSLKKVDGKYSEVFYMNKKKSISGAFRNYQTPSGRWLSPNNAKDAYLVDQARKEYPNTVDLLNYLINQKL